MPRKLSELPQYKEAVEEEGSAEDLLFVNGILATSADEVELLDAETDLRPDLPLTIQLYWSGGRKRRFDVPAE